jgi:hypothetical protein
LGVERGVAGAVHALYTSIDDTSLAVPEMIGVLEQRG